MNDSNKAIFLQDKEEIIRLAVSIDYESLLKLKKEIIVDCSKVNTKTEKKRYHNFERFMNSFKNDDHYELLEYKIIQDSYHDCGYGDDDKEGIIEITYKEYNYPSIVDNISQILKGKFGGELGFNISFDQDDNDKQRKSFFEESISTEVSLVLDDTQLDFCEKRKKILELLHKEQNLGDASEDNKAILNHYYKKIFDCFIINDINYCPLLEFQKHQILMNNNATIISIDSLDSNLRNLLLQKIEDDKSNKRKSLKKSREKNVFNL